MKLFIPGPIWCREDVLAEMSQQPIGHRRPEFSDLYNAIVPKLQKLLFTEQAVYMSTSSGSGVWELAVRNCVRKKALACMCGAFSDKWAQVARLNGKEVVELKVEWGKPVTAEQVATALAVNPDVDAVLYCHNETSTGLTNPLAEVAKVVNGKDDTLLLVDAVSSMAGLKIEIDNWGIDICLASGQKALGIPPGMAVFAASDRAHARAETVENRGYYFDLLGFRKSAVKGQTITTPAIPHMYGLRKMLEGVEAEGIEARFARHREMADYVRGWARDRGFEMFPEAGYESDTLSCVANTRGIDINALNDFLLAKHDCIISNGYGDLKNRTFRIAHMGDMTLDMMKELTAAIDGFLGQA